MNRKTKKGMLPVVLVLAALGLTLLPGAGLAQGPDEEAVAFGPRGPRAPRDFRSRPLVRRMMQQLELDESQSEAIRSIIESSRDDAEPLREDLRSCGHTLRDLFEDESAGEAALESAISDVIEARKALHDHREAVMDQVRDVLTPHQQAKLVLMVARRGPPGPRGHRSGPGPR